MDGENSGSSPHNTKNFKNGTYRSPACAGHNEHELGGMPFSHKDAAYTLFNRPPDKGRVI